MSLSEGRMYFGTPKESLATCQRTPTSRRIPVGGRIRFTTAVSRC
jgi:hypothetical protein